MSTMLTEVLARMNGRQLDPIPDSDLEYAETHRVYIYNVWKTEHRIDSVPGLGAVLIPACQPGKRYSLPCVVPGKVFDYYDDGDGKLLFRTFPARSYTDRRGRVVPGAVDDILKSYTPRGQFSPNLIQWGVFAAADELPTEAELQQSAAELRRTAFDFVTLADALWLQGDQGRREINQMHREMAQLLGLRKPWLEEQKEQESREACPACGEEIKPGIARCPHCTAILDPAKWALFSGEAPHRGPGRPRKDE